MKIVKQNQTKVYVNSPRCRAIEYPLSDKDINGAVIEIDGRYPDIGRVMNTKCKELAYVIEGRGIVSAEGKEVKINKGDLIFLEPGDRYFWEGKLTMFVPCTPAWYPEQHRETD